MSVFNDASNKQSFSRISGAAVLLWCMGASSYLIYKTGVMVDLPVFGVSLVLAMYGLNKFAPVNKPAA